MPKETKDLVIIGGGPAGYVAANRAAQLGASVALVEKKSLGGTCLNEGCVPTKTLAKTAELFSQTFTLKEKGIDIGPASLNFPVVQERKQQVVQSLQQGVSFLLNANKVSCFEGEAVLKSPREIEVWKNGEVIQSLETAKIILAAGSVPIELPGLPFDGENILNSSQILELNAIPSSLVIVGGGVIGVEMASIFAQFGTTVHLVELLPEIMSFLDENVVTLLKESLSQKGVKITTSTKVTKVEKEPGSLKVTMEQEGKVSHVETEKVLVVAGRKPNINIKGLNQLGLEMNKGTVVVDKQMKTSLENIYAAGDFIGGYQLAHVAYHEGLVAAENCLGNNLEIDYKAVPQCVYTHPEISFVGLTEKDAREKYDSVQVGVFPFSANNKALSAGDFQGFVKVVFEEKYHELVGVSIIGLSATELIHEAAAAMKLEATMDELLDIIHAHPTLSESFGEAVFLAAKKPLHFPG